MKSLNSLLAVTALTALFSGTAFADSEEPTSTKSENSAELELSTVDCPLPPIEKTLLLEMKINDRRQSVKSASFFINPCKSKFGRTGFSEALNHSYIRGFEHGAPIVKEVVTGYHANFTYSYEAETVLYDVEYTYPTDFVETDDEFIPLTSTFSASGVVRMNVQEGVLFKMPIGDKGKDEAELTFRVLD